MSQQQQQPYFFIAGRVASYTTTSFTSSSYTNSLDLQEPICKTMANFVKAKWPTFQSILKPSQIKFDTKWFNDYGSYQIHFRDTNVPHRPVMVGWQYTYVSTIVDAHIFVRKNSFSRPAELDDIKRQIEYVVMTNRTSFPIAQPFATFMQIVREFDVVERVAATQSLWHSVVQIELRFWKATSN